MSNIRRKLKNKKPPAGWELIEEVTAITARTKSGCKPWSSALCSPTYAGHRGL
jgi:hypothetical protein